MTSSLIREKLSNLVKTPGCYLMKDKNGQIIYVGKAKNLKSRGEGFNSSKDHSKVKSLGAEI